MRGSEACSRSGWAGRRHRSQAGTSSSLQGVAADSHRVPSITTGNCSSGNATPKRRANGQRLNGKQPNGQQSRHDSKRRKPHGPPRM